MYKCPSCGSSEIMIVRVEVDASIDSGGTLECQCNNMEFSGSGRIDCGVCGHHGAARTFEFPDPPPEREQFGMNEETWGQFLSRMGLDGNESNA